MDEDSPVRVLRPGVQADRVENSLVKWHMNLGGDKRSSKLRCPGHLFRAQQGP